MNNQKLVVVGDKFHQFAKAENTITLSQLDAMINTPSKLFLAKKELKLGLGCNQEYYDKVIAEFNNKQKTLEHLNIEELILRSKGNKIANQYTHQHSLHNVLIGQTKKLNDMSYEIPFIVDDRCILMGDHQTGLHIQGMIINEAFRQSFIAVTEEFYLKKDGVDKYFVINEMNIKFDHFVFPLPARINFEFINIDATDFRIKCHAKMEMVQADKVCASMNTRFVVYPANYITDKEKEMADHVLYSFLSANELAEGKNVN